jgi:hypothetical protein
MDGGAEGKGFELEVKRCHHRSRTAQTVLASVYEQLVASGRRARPAWRRAEPDFGQEVAPQKRTVCAGG